MQITLGGICLKRLHFYPTIVLFAVMGAVASRSHPVKSHEASYAYRSPQLTLFINDSFNKSGRSGAERFYSWFDEQFGDLHLTYRGQAGSPTALCKSEQTKISRFKNSADRVREELAFASWLHESVRKALPHFSLDRGFEFANAMSNGERQCLLQSVLAASLLQSAGINAGITMVYKSVRGEPSNNGHVVTLMRLDNAQDIILDLSEDEPFVNQQGLFTLANGHYRYIKPLYAQGHQIKGYKLEAGGTVSPDAVSTLDVAFIQSQFDYYRGEHTPWGVMADRRTDNGLRVCEQHLENSVNECPGNPLPLVILGRVHWAQGKHIAAKQEVRRAISMYREYGWTPDGAKEAVTLTRINVE